MAYAAAVAATAACEPKPLSDFIDPPSHALTLSLESSSRYSEVAYGGAQSNSDSMVVSLTGRNADTASWRATKTHSWIQFVRDSGVGSGILRWNRIATGFPAGLYVDTIRILATGAIGDSSLIVDSLVVLPPRPTTLSLSVTPKSRYSDAPEDDDVTYDSATVTLGGSMANEVTWFASKRGAWTNLTTYEGSGSGKLRWRRRLGDLAAGLYVDTITISASGLKTQIVDSVYVAPDYIPTTLSVSPNSHRDSVALGSTQVRRDSVLVKIGGTNATAMWSATKKLPSTTLINAGGEGTGYLKFERQPAGLAEGVYIDTLTVSLVDGSAPSVKVIDTLKVGAVPEPLTLALLGRRGRTHQVTSGETATFRDSSYVSIGGDGSATAAWSASARKSNTTMVAASGTGSGYMIWTRNATGLAVGYYVDTITATVSGASGSPARIFDTIYVAPAPVPLTVTTSPKTVKTTAVVGSSSISDSAQVIISGTGASTASWAATNRATWNTLTEFNGVGSAILRWTRQLSGLVKGTYVDTIRIAATGASDALLIDSVVIQDPPPPDQPLTLSVTPKSAFGSAIEGSTALQPVTGTVNLTGNGASTTSWSATKRKSWITLDVAAGLGSGSVKWTRNPIGLTVGNHVDTITISAANAAGSPARIIDTLRIFAAPDTTPMGNGEAASPTGRSPKLLWTRHRQWVWNQMRAENHPWFALIKSNADKTLTAAERYGDKGQWAMLYYQITGDRTYGRKAWDKVRTWIDPTGLSQNEVRENFAEAVMMYDWLYPVLTAAERQEFITDLNGWGNFALGNLGTYTGGFRTSDSDQTTGAYFGLAFLDLATAPENPLAGTWLRAVDRSGIPMGGLTATGVDRNTVRNTIAQYVSMAEGGDWIESAQYNAGTTVLLMMGAEGVRTATGVDYFPEVTRFTKQLSVAYTYLVTPDLNKNVQWGDEEHPRDFVGRLFRHVSSLAVVAGITEGSVEGRYSQGMIAELVSRYGYVGYGSAEPNARALYLYSPYAAAQDWRSLPAYHLSSGVGLAYYKDGGGVFMTHAADRLGVDHQTSAMGTFHLYRNGEWVVTHPIGYGSTAVGATAANTMLLAGLNVMYQRSIVQSRTGSGWASMTTQSRGSYYDPSYYNPPPSFLDVWVRSVVYLQESGADVIVTWDSVTADDPEGLPNFSRYRAADQAIIKAATHLVEWQIHTPVSPTIGSGKISWTTAGGQRVVVHMLSSTPQTATTYDEKVMWSTSNNFFDSEKRYQVRVAKSTQTRSQVFLNVIVVGSTTLTPTAISGGVRIGTTTITFGPTGVTVTR